MLLRRILLGLLLALGSLAASRAQTPTDTIAAQLDARLRSRLASPLLRLVQAREEIARELRQDRVSRVPALLDYLSRQATDSLAALRLQPHEHWAVLAAAAEFYPLLKAVEADGQRRGYRGRAYPAALPDGLYDAARGYVRRHAEELARTARQARFLPEDSTFLQLSIRLLAGENSVSDSLNHDLHRFVQRYPGTPYGYLVGPRMRYEYLPGLLEFGLDFSVGGASFRGDLNKAFKPAAVFGMGGEAAWKRAVVYLRLFTGYADPRAPYRFDGTVWNPDLSLQYYLPEVAVGYRVLDARRLRLAPYAGLTYCYFRPNPAEKAPPELDRRLPFARPFTAGLRLDVKLGTGGPYASAAPAQQGLLLRLRGGWRQLEATLGPPLTGSVYFVEVGVGMFERLPRLRRW